MGKDVIIACDFADKKTCLEFLDKFEGKKPFVKIGMELFYAEGPEIVREIKARGHTIFRTQLKNQWRYYRALILICATCTRRALPL